MKDLHTLTNAQLDDLYEEVIGYRAIEDGTSRETAIEILYEHYLHITYIPATFTTDHEHFYAGEYNPFEDWNGYAVPRFTKEVAEQILKDTRPDFDWGYDAANDRFFGICEHIGFGYTWPCEDNNYQRRYSIGGCEWVWKAVEKQT